MLKEPFITKEVTVRPRMWKGSVGLRMELYGCKLGKLCLCKSLGDSVHGSEGMCEVCECVKRAVSLFDFLL